MEAQNYITYIEWLGVITGLISVWLTVKENIWCWPVGIVSVGALLVVFSEARLYADMGLQAVFIILSLYGWYEWLRGGKDKGELEVSNSSTKLNLVLASIAFAGTAVMGYLLSTWTDAALPYWDSLMTVLSLIAQWMMAKKLLQSWIVWISVDLISIGIYFAKGLYPTLLLYTIFLVLATLGYIEWRKTLARLQLA
jgi:nicotinamide mononucleotide transporter